jgi:hypothetical protein
VVERALAHRGELGGAQHHVWTALDEPAATEGGAIHAGHAGRQAAAFLGACGNIFAGDLQAGEDIAVRAVPDDAGLVGQRHIGRAAQGDIHLLVELAGASLKRQRLDQLEAHRLIHNPFLTASEDLIGDRSRLGHLTLALQRLHQINQDQVAIRGVVRCKPLGLAQQIHRHAG